MKIERKTQESNEISTSSLPDIIFMLLIFFMVTTVMREFDGLDVLMPRAKMIEKLESKRHTSYVWATKDKLISVDDRLTRVDGSIVFDEKLKKMHEIKGLVENEIRKNKNMIFSIKTSTRADYQDYVALLDEFKKAKAKKISIANDHRK